MIFLDSSVAPNSQIWFCIGQTYKIFLTCLVLDFLLSAFWRSFCMFEGSLLDLMSKLFFFWMTIFCHYWRARWFLWMTIVDHCWRAMWFLWTTILDAPYWRWRSLRLIISLDNPLPSKLFPWQPSGSPSTKDDNHLDWLFLWTIFCHWNYFLANHLDRL